MIVMDKYANIRRELSSVARQELWINNNNK